MDVREVIKREVAIFAILFVFLSLGMHFKAFTTDPAGQFEKLPGSPLGPYHPLILTAGIYLLILIVRLSVKGVKKLSSKKS